MLTFFTQIFFDALFTKIFLIATLLLFDHLKFIWFKAGVLWISFHNLIRVIPQGTVDDNLGPDRLAGPKALDPNSCRQPTHWLHDLCLEVLIVHINELHLFGPGIPSTRTINVFSYDAVRADHRSWCIRLTTADHRAHHLALSMPYVLCHRRSFKRN